MADDPLAPIQPGDDVRKIFSASRQNALADAARIVRGSLPVRWARKRNRKHAKPGDPTKLFELKTALTPGGTADAYPLDDEGEPITDDSDVVFEVEDVRGIYRGRAKDAYSSPHDQGSRGEARLRNGVWEITYLTPHALAIRGQLTDDLADTDSTFDIDNVIILQPEGSIIVDHDPADATTVNNTFAHEGDNNGIARADWNQSTGEWDSLQTACKAES
jgi:hypothetical protein